VDDRYRYVIELGRTLAPMPEAEHSQANKVQGCASQVWLSKQVDRSKSDEPHLNYLGDSDAHIVRGLIAILLTLFSGHRLRLALTPPMYRSCCRWC
jgi:cysteine desulfuration protein SufE